MKCQNQNYFKWLDKFLRQQQQQQFKTILKEQQEWSQKWAEKATASSLSRAWPWLAIFSFQMATLISPWFLRWHSTTDYSKIDKIMLEQTDISYFQNLRLTPESTKFLLTAFQIFGQFSGFTEWRIPQINKAYPNLNMCFLLITWCTFSVNIFGHLVIPDGWHWPQKVILVKCHSRAQTWGLQHLIKGHVT